MSSMTTTDNKAFLNELARLVGSSHLLTDPAKTARYRKGFRSGQGDALAVVFPGSLLELWRVLKACVTADKIILMQAANTGLTEGSTPNGNDYDRDVVIISTLRLDKLHVLGKGEQVLAYPGTTLYSLEKALKPLGHDRRYAIDAEKIGRALGWKPQETFESGIRKTVEWYLSNTKWVDNVKSGAYQSWIEQNYEGRQ